jgi:hypothetical protein
LLFLQALSDHHVLLEGTLLKPNMVRSGEAASVQVTTGEYFLVETYMGLRCFAGVSISILEYVVDGAWLIPGSGSTFSWSG